MEALQYIPVDISQTLAKRAFPTALMWNRLEARPKAHDFNKALKAEVRDALWMLTKQWQMGEFNGDDAGSPVFAKVHITSSHVDSYNAAKKGLQNFEPNIPLEVKVEQKKIPFIRDDKEISIDIRLQLGKYWLKLLKENILTSSFSAEYIKKYNFKIPLQTRDTDYIYAHKEVWQKYAAISGRSMDGYKLYEHINGTSNKASDGILNTDAGIAITNTEKDKLAQLGDELIRWFTSQYYQPTEEKNNAWLPDQLEYQFDCTATAKNVEKTLQAKEYYHGHLDWYAFDITQKRINTAGQAKEKFTSTFIPTHVQFDGMPDTRWWKFEDGKTSFGDVKPNTTDLAKLLLIEFGLVFANDWFIIPYTLPIGSLANVEGLTVKNNFGETLWIKVSEDEKSKGLPWSMFKLKSEQQNNSLFLAPAAVKVQEGNSLEEIVLIRDEMSNMVWGVETIAPMPFGEGNKGSEKALQVRQYHEKFVQQNAIPQTVPYAAKVSYLAMSDVPEHWIPFVPVYKKNSNREIQLQRASMLRIIEQDPIEPVKIKPQTSVLREGLENENPDGTANPLAYFINEEEVPRSGVTVSQSFQRTRWTNGEVFVWLGMKKETGRGEGSSGLAFDQLVNGKVE
jgi:hypothetical protein